MGAPQTIHSMLMARVIAWVKRYERHLAALAFLLGFLGDTLFLPRIDSWGAYAVLGVYLLSAMLCIFFAQLHETKHPLAKYLSRIQPLFSVTIQLFFGSLMSAIFVYYSRSASIIDSAPFLLLLLTIFVGNEIARDRLRRLEFQLATLFFIIFMGMTFAIPVYLGSIGVLVFLASQLLAVVVMMFYIFLLAHFAPKIIERGRRVFIGSVCGIVIVLNGLYFTHLIPPIPLSLRVGEVYHYVFRADDNTYKTLGEPALAGGWFAPFYSRVHVDGSPLYFFSAVFAPTTFATSIVHVWQYYDEQKGAWTTRHRITFPISGGRAQGYRGYSIGEDIAEGKWRVRVETPRGELLGTGRFVAIPLTESIDYVEGVQ